MTTATQNDSSTGFDYGQLDSDTADFVRDATQKIKVIVDRNPGIFEELVDDDLIATRGNTPNADDVIDEENSATPEGRAKLEDLLYGAVKGSLAPATEFPDAKLVMLQTPLNKEEVEKFGVNNELIARRRKAKDIRNLLNESLKTYEVIMKAEEITRANNIIEIEVYKGMVEDVRNIPEGYEYEIIDKDVQG